MDDIRPESAVSKAFPDFDEEPVRDAVEELERLVKSETLLCKLEIDMMKDPFAKIAQGGARPGLVRIESLLC
jgi:hypothetical protein